MLRGKARCQHRPESAECERSVCQACARGEDSAAFVEIGRRAQALIVAEPASADGKAQQFKGDRE